MVFDLVNFMNEKIDVIVNVDGKEFFFNIKNYIEVYKVKNVRLYLRFRKLYDYSSEECNNKDILLVIDFGCVE